MSLSAQLRSLIYVIGKFSGQIRDSFFSCLNHKFPNLIELRNILAGIVEHINNRLEKGDQLRVKVPAEVNPPYFSIRSLH